MCSWLRSGLIRGLLLADRVEDADEAALVAAEDVDESVQRGLERPDEFREQLLLGGKGGERLDLRRVDELSVDVGGSDVDRVGLVRERLDGLRPRYGVFAGEDDARRPREDRVELRCELFARSTLEERVLHNAVGAAVFAKLVAEL